MLCRVIELSYRKVFITYLGALRNDADPTHQVTLLRRLKQLTGSPELIYFMLRLVYVVPMLRKVERNLLEH
jgi:hypothetical protein